MSHRPHDTRTPQHTAVPRRRPRRFLLVPAAVLAAAIAAGVWPRLNAQAALQSQTAALAVPTVQTTQATVAAAAQERVLPADVQAQRQTTIFARTSGYLKSWSADIGAHVKAGQLLAVIDAPEVDDQLRQARADEAQAQANAQLAHISAQRWQLLLQTNSVSRQDADIKAADAQAKQAVLDAARSNVARLSQLQAYEKVYAPFDGVVTARAVDVGALIEAGSTGGPAAKLFDIADTHTLRVFADLSQSDAVAAVNGASAYLSLPQYPGRQFAGVVARNTGAIDPVTRTLRFEVDIPNADGTVLPGSYGQVHIVLNHAHPGLSLPVNALLYRPQGLQVACVDAQQKVRLKAISVGRDFGSRIEVTAGLAANDRVILNPGDSISDGESVRLFAAPASGAATQ